MIIPNDWSDVDAFAGQVVAQSLTQYGLELTALACGDLPQAFENFGFCLGGEFA